MDLNAQPPPNSDRQSPQPNYRLQPPPSMPESQKSSPKTAILLIGLFILACLVVAGIFLFRKSGTASLNETLENLDIQCAAISDEDLEGRIIAQVATILKRGQVCKMLNPSKTESASEYLYYLRITQSDYEVVKKAIREDFETKDESSDPDGKSAAYKIWNSCNEDSSLYGLLYRNYDGEQETESETLGGDWTQEPIILFDDDVVNVGTDVFIDLTFGLWQLREALKEQGVESEIAKAPCPALESDLKSSETQALIDSQQYHFSYFGNIQPKLSAPAADYVFLSGDIFESQSSCLIVNYKIAYKAQWGDTHLEGAFNNDRFFEDLREKLQKLYPEKSDQSRINLEVHQYSGSDESYEYSTISAEDSNFKEYERSTCQ